MMDVMIASDILFLTLEVNLLNLKCGVKDALDAANIG